MSEKPIRICVIGNSGSGKSTLSKRLAAEFGVPVFHLDRELLTGDFEIPEREVQAGMHQAVIDNDAWVIDGNYSRQLQRERVKRATLVVFINSSRFVSIPRVIMRSRKGGQSEDTVPDGAKRQALRWSYLQWVATYSRRKRARYLRELCAEFGVPFLLLPNDSVEGWVKRVKRVVLD